MTTKTIHTQEGEEGESVATNHNHPSSCIPVPVLPKSKNALCLDITPKTAALAILSSETGNSRADANDGHDRERLWKPLPFDSRVLGVQSASLKNDIDDISPTKVQALLGDCASQGIELIYWTPKNPQEQATAAIVENENWFSGYVVSEAVEFQRQLVELPGAALTTTTVIACEEEGERGYRLPDDFTIEALSLSLQEEGNNHHSLFCVSDGSKIDVDKIIDLAYVAGEHSRFRQDPALTPAQFRSMYSAWTQNSLNGKVADQVFVARTRSDDETAPMGGLITLKSSSDKSNVTIGLLAVSPDHQRKGLGSALITQAMAWARTQGALQITVKTQADNLQAMSFYAAQGYRPVGDAVKMYHIWLTDRLLKGVRYNFPYLTGKEAKEISSLISANALDSLGQYTISCERWLETTLECPKVLLTPSATAALEEAALLCGFRAEDEVIMPSFTFVSTANAVALRGATPVFVDVDRTTLNIDVQRIKDAVTPKTKAIIVVHYGGEACEMDPIMAFAKEKGLFVIEDAAQALLSTYKGRYLGTIGHLGCLSFHYTKNTICGEGGALLVNDQRFHSMSTVIREKGTNRTDFMLSKVDKYEWLSLGSSYVPSELSSAFLLVQLADARESAKRRNRICQAYRTLLAPLAEKGSFDFLGGQSHGKIDGLSDDTTCGNGHIFVLVFPTAEDRKAAQETMKDRSVQCLTHFVPLHLSKGGRRYGRTSGSLECTSMVHSCLLRLPVWPGMHFGHVHYVVSGLFEHYCGQGMEGKVHGGPCIHAVAELFLPHT